MSVDLQELFHCVLCSEEHHEISSFSEKWDYFYIHTDQKHNNIYQRLLMKFQSFIVSLFSLLFTMKR